MGTDQESAYVEMGAGVLGAQATQTPLLGDEAAAGRCGGRGAQGGEAPRADTRNEVGRRSLHSTRLSLPGRDACVTFAGAIATAALLAAGAAAVAVGVPLTPRRELAFPSVRPLRAAPHPSDSVDGGASAPEAGPFERVLHPVPPSEAWGNTSFPLPTGAWWTNLVVEDGFQRPGNQPVVPLPYAIRNANGRGMEVSYGPTRRHVTPLFEGDFFGADLVVGTAGNGWVPQTYKHAIVHSDGLTLGVGFDGSSGPEQRFVARLARGAPWIVTEWAGATPSLTSDFAFSEVASLVIRAGARRSAGESPGASSGSDGSAEDVTSPVGSDGGGGAGIAEQSDHFTAAAVDPLCSAHADCAVLAASVADGLCCPLTANNIMLECCDAPAPGKGAPDAGADDGRRTGGDGSQGRPGQPERSGGGVGPSDLFRVKLQTGSTWLIAFDSPVELSWAVSPAKLEATSGYSGAVRMAFAHDWDSALALAPSAHGPYAVAGRVKVAYDGVQEGGDDAHDDQGRGPGLDDGGGGSVLQQMPNRMSGGASAWNGGRGAGAGTTSSTDDRGLVMGATLSFEWDVVGDASGAEQLVTLALPHHVAALATGTVVRDGPKFETIKGVMTPIRGNSWSVYEKFANVSWFPASNPAHGLESALLSSLKADLTEPLVLAPDAKDPYGFGKQSARLARLALIAEQLGDKASLRTAVSALVLALEPWLLGVNPAPWPNAPVGSGALVYDQTYGGLVSRVSLADPGADFGNGRYNDHHFQYGYLLYASAVACRHDGTFCDKHRNAITDIARDITSTPDEAAAPGARFPVARCKDLFDGHSWASGLFQMANGKAQESSSEAVNAYYSAVLLAQALGDAKLERWARLLLATEIRGAQWYWHVPSNSAVYDRAFVANNRMVGVVGATDVNVATWFGGQIEFVHGINIMPVTPVTEMLMPAAFVAEEYAQLSQRQGQMDPAWAGFAIAAHAIINPELAESELASLKSFDNGNSRTNMLHWVATRPPPPAPVMLALALLRSPSALGSTVGH